MSIVACEKCRVRYDLPESEVASHGNGAGTSAICGLCGDALAPAPAAPTDLLDELLSMAPAAPARHHDAARATPPLPPPPELSASGASVELIEHRGKDVFMGGRQVPLESGLLNVRALEAHAVELASSASHPVPEPKLSAPAAPQPVLTTTPTSQVMPLQSLLAAQAEPQSTAQTEPQSTAPAAPENATPEGATRERAATEAAAQEAPAQEAPAREAPDIAAAVPAPVIAIGAASVERATPASMPPPPPSARLLPNPRPSSAPPPPSARQSNVAPRSTAKPVQATPSARPSRAPAPRPPQPPVASKGMRSNGNARSEPPPTSKRPFDGSEPVSALPPVVSGPPQDLVLSPLQPKVAPVVRRTRDSLDDGWEAMSPAAPVVVIPPVRPAEALPAVRLPWEILAEDSLATEGETVPLATIPIAPSQLAPKAPEEDAAKPAMNGSADSSSWIANAEVATAEADTDGGEWTNVPDESLTADAPNEPPFEPLQDAVTGDSAPLHTPPESAPILDAPWVTRQAEAGQPTASAAPAPADSAFGSSSVPPVFQSSNFYGATPTKKSLVARLAPFVGGAAALALAGWLVFGDFSKKKPAHSSTAVAAARPAAQTEKPKHSPPPAAPPAAAPTPAPAAAVQPVPAEQGPTSTAKFNNKAANVSLGKLLARARSACKKPGDPSGTALAIVTFANTGRVVATNVSGVKITGTPVATCIANTLKSAKVPPFAGEAVTMKKTLKLK